jgi:hypothetical protein
MSPEQQPSGPERRAFYTPPGPQAKEIVRSALAELDDVEIEFRLVSAFDHHGAGFAAFLRLSDTQPSNPSIVENYEQVYGDAWDSLDDIAADTVEALGWADSLRKLQTSEAIPEGLLEWNQEGLHAWIREAYDVVVVDEVLHLFHR